ncbi:MAG: hypothetical protein AAF583_00540 [Pseudomonadota bacterium]
MAHSRDTLNSMLAKDPLTGPTRAERVNYATGVMLSSEDFRDEQTYHRARLATLLQNLVGHGTLAGLAVRTPAEEDNDLKLVIEPGVAIDRYGRLIEITEPWCIRLSKWFMAEATGNLRAAVHRKPRTSIDVAVVADVFLGLADCGRGRTPSFAEGPFDALDSLVPSRVAEQPNLELVLRAEGPPGDIPSPKNHWPGRTASNENKLKSVLGSYSLGLHDGIAGELAPLNEHVTGRDPASVLLARIAMPVKIAADAPADERPKLDLTSRVQVDNSIRPFIWLPGKWLGSPPHKVPVGEP